MRLFPQEPQIGNHDGFTKENDIFQREALGQGMTKLVTRVEHPLVIALDGKWGSGKTVFLKQWAGELRKKNFPVIYYDAFANDHFEDAFLALSSEIVGLLKEHEIKGGKEKIEKTIKKIAKIAAPAIAKAGIQIATGGLVNATGINVSSDAISENTAEAYEKYLNKQISETENRKQDIENFKTALSELPSLLTQPSDKEENVQKNENKPLIFIIDELDRCRPDYALNILERIKHFFSVLNVHFVFGVNLEQLENSIKASYGGDLDATTYLQKFIHLTVPLVQVPDRNNLTDLDKYVEYIKSNLNCHEEDFETLEYAGKIILRIARLNSLSLRQVERIFSILALTLASTQNNQLRIPALLAGLSVLRVIQPESFIKAKQGGLRFEDVQDILHLDTSSDGNLEVNYWLYVTGQETDIDETLNNEFFRYQQFEKTKILPNIANYVIDRIYHTGEDFKDLPST